MDQKSIPKGWGSCRKSGNYSLLQDHLTAALEVKPHAAQPWEGNVLGRS